MRTINLKMRDSPNYHHLGGQRGDHRMTRLVIPLPKLRHGCERVCPKDTQQFAHVNERELSSRSNSRIRSCVALFSADNELVLSPLILPGDGSDAFIQDGKAHIVLWQRLTQCWVLRVQIEAFGDVDGKQFLARTAISEPVVFSKSLTDTIDTSHLPNAKAITELLEAMHRHGNKSILGELGDLAGALTYKGDNVSADALTNCEINDLINQALAALG